MMIEIIFLNVCEGHKETSGRDGSCRDKNVEVCYGSDEKRQDYKRVHQEYR